jgi:lipid A ethanolaminephosphotransferase
MPFVRSSRLRVTHTTFLLAFPALLYGACNAFHMEKLSRWFQGKEGLEVVPFLAYLLAGLCLFIAVFALLAHRWTIKPVAIALIISSGVATYFITKYNVAIDSSMVLNTVHTDLTEVGQLMSWQMVPYAIFLIVIPIIVILRTEISFAAEARYLLASGGVLGISLLVSVAILYATFNGIHRAANVSNKYIVYTLVPINIISGSFSAASRSLRPYLQGDPSDLDIPARVTRPGNLVVVLAIGESSRRQNFGVYGYSRRDTTPRLRETRDVHFLNGFARRGSTIYALREILEVDGIKLPAVISHAGIPVACYVNYTLYDNCSAVGEVKVGNCGHGGKCYDEDVLPLLKRDLASYASGYRFVVLHFGGGSHGPLYANRHPPEFTRFTPTCDDADVASQCSIEELHNSYDNTILYVDHVVAESIRALDQSGVPYVFIYLSDHGESLLEDGNLFHGMPPGVRLPKEQADIPLIVKSSVPISLDSHAIYRQPEVFDTVLDLFGIQARGFDLAGSFITRREAQKDER